MRRVLTRDHLTRLLRARWLFAVVVLLLVLGALIATQSSHPALAADTRGATEPMSVDNGNVLGHADSFNPAISANGRFVAFTSLAALDPLDAQNDGSGHHDEDIYVRDSVAGHTTLLSVGDNDGSAAAADGNSFSPSMSASGRYVAFVTNAPDLLAETPSSVTDTAVICDRGAPAANGTFGNTCRYTKIGTNAGDSAPQLSADGTRMAYIHNNKAVIVDLTIDPATGVITDPTPSSFSSPPIPATLTINAITLFPQFDFAPALSANGRYLLRITEYADDSFGHDLDVLLLNDLNNPTAPAMRFDFASSAATSFVGNETNFLSEPAISGDGRRIAFTESTTDGNVLVLHAIDRDPNGDGNLGPSTTQSITADIVSRDVNGHVVSGAAPSFSTEGRYLAFVTDASHVHQGVDDATRTASCINVPLEAFTTPLAPAGAAKMRLAAATGISHCDVVVRDLVQDAQRVAAGLPRLPAELASPSQQSVLPSTTPPVACDPVCEGDGESDLPALDADGSAVAFSSGADNLLQGAASDPNTSTDVFKRTFKPVPVVAPLNFGDVVINTTVTGTAQVIYAGFGPLQISTIAIGGPQAGDFTVFPGETCTGRVLHSGDTCDVSIRFRPSALNARNATLTLTTSTGVPGVGTLSGNGVPEPPPKTPVFQAAPNPLAFGPQQLFTPTAAKTVTVTNAGTGPLTISAVTLVGAAPTNFPGDYQITANTCLAAAVAPLATCTVSLTFAPQAVGDRPALLQFTDNATPGPQLVGLTGSGNPPTLVASPPLAPPGAVSRVTGTGFPPGKVVLLTLDLMPGAVTATASATGTFTAPLVIFPHTASGKRKLHATVQGVPTPIVVSIDYLVVPGSLMPPDFAERR